MKVELPMRIAEKNVKEELYITHLGKNDIILGFDWLQKHNPCINWKIGTLNFQDWKVLVKELEEPFFSNINTLPVDHRSIIEEALNI